MLAWHIAQTRPTLGMHAERWLNESLGFEVFNPKVRTRRLMGRGRVTTTKRLYIPGYIFIRFCEDEDEWRPINWTPGISSLMYLSGETPATIPDEALEPLIGLCDEWGFIQEAAADAVLFEVGKQVRILEGAYAGWAGSIEAVQGKRLHVIMRMFGRDTRVQIGKRDCELLTT